MTTNPISANQIVDVNIDLKCLEVDCKTLPNVLQAVVDKVCETVTDSNEFTPLDFKCLDAVTTQTAFNQEVVDKLCELEESGGPNAPVCNLNYCASDNWDCQNRDTCLIVTNPCNPTTVTTCDVLQAMIKRMVAQGDVIIDLCSRVTTLESRVNTIQTQLTIIQTTCCNG